MKFFDTHAHLNSDIFEDDLPAVLDRCAAVGVTDIAVIGVDVATSEKAVQLAKNYPGQLHAVVGIQPNSVAASNPNDFDRIIKMVEEGGVIAVGETGLDCYWDDTPLDDQIAMFDRHIDLCLQYDLPMVIHMRESCQLIIDQLSRRNRLPSGIMHSFTGTHAQAAACIDFGLMISFAGMVTFKKSDDLREVAAGVPDDRLLIETDSPYLSPEPLRGRRPNDPSRVIHIAECLAKVRGTDVPSLAQQTASNAKRLFKLS